jgi:hypothetical protein
MERKTKRMAIGCGLAFALVVGLVVVFLVVLGAAIETGMVPDTAAKPVGKIPSRQLRKLQEMGVTREGEKVLFFYSAAFLDIRGDGNLFTDQRVISYYDADGTLDISAASFDEIAEIDFAPSDSWLEDSTITITKRDGTWFVLYVSTDSHGDELFHSKLMAEWAKHKNEGPLVEAVEEAEQAEQERQSSGKP